MDEIEYKLESKNPVLISHAVSRIFEAIQRKCEDGQGNIGEIPEFKRLLARRDSNDTMLSMAVCHALIILVENGLWGVNEAISSFVSSLSTTKNYATLATALSKLLILDLKRNSGNRKVYQFTLLSPQHPFILILSEDKYSWHTILKHIKYVLNHQDRQIRKVGSDVLRPVFIYVLCHPSSTLSLDCKRQLWQTLLNSNSSIALQTELLSWLCTNQPSSCITSNSIILEFTEVAVQQKKQENCDALLPVLASYTIQMIKHGLDPVLNFDAMLEIANRPGKESGNLSLAVMAEMITICPAIYLYNALQICKLIMDKTHCHELFVKILVAALLKWMTYPSLLCSSALDIAKELISKPLSQKEYSNIPTEPSTEIFKVFNRSDAQVRFYTEAIRCAKTWDNQNILPWLEYLSTAPMGIRDKCKLLVSGLFLQTRDPRVANLSCTILVEISREMNSFSSHVLSLVLHKLTVSRDAGEIKHLLSCLPNLLTTKENVPLVTHTLDAVMQVNSCFGIELYLRSNDREPRLYRLLSAALIRTMKVERVWYADAVCARAMHHICKYNPHNGQRLIPLLSEILNRCVGTNGGTACAFALKSISALCKEAIVGVRSTWQVLEPKMREETRTVVLEAFCEFLGDIHTHHFHADEDYERQMYSMLQQLWRYTVGSDSRVADAAFKAISCYTLMEIPFFTLPAEFQRSLPAPSASSEQKNLQSELTENCVPGSCWIDMLQNVNKANLTAAGDLLISFIKTELKSFHSQIYVWPHGEPKSFKYLPQYSAIRAVGEHLRRCDKSDPENRRTIVECLRIFAYRYAKPLPNVVWSFLEETIRISPEAKEYTLQIACNVSMKSLSAKSFIENYLAGYRSREEADPLLQSNEYLILYSSLDHLYQAISPNIMNPFLEVTFEYVLGKLNFRSETPLDAFDRLMNAYATVLRNPADNDTTPLATILEKLLEKFDLTESRFKSYFTAAVELSMNHLERMTSPKVWWEVTPEKFKNAIAVRTEFAIRKRPKSPLTWLDESIEIAVANPSVQPFLLQSLHRVQLKMQFEKSTMTWVVNLLSEIQSLILEPSEMDNNRIEFYCHVLFASVISLSGMDCMLTEKDSLITSQDICGRMFPQAVAILIEQQDWKDVTPKMMEWLNDMRTSRLPEMYKSIFTAALICTRNNPHYKTVWMKYLSHKTITDV